ncbi:MAG: hypothetical protein Q8K32_01270 [Archangium sp.]|nr:hypothetical protein [Archangium sp.]
MKRVLAVMVFMSACANSTPAPESPKPLDTTVRMQSPIKVTWEEISRTDTEAVVLAKVERVNKLDMSFLMSVELPPGVKLVEGRTQLTLLPNTEAVTVSERLTLSFTAPVEGDAQLKLDGDSGAMGFHAKVPYRFGRPAPDETGPSATGVEPRKGDKKFGPSVPLK